MHEATTTPDCSPDQVRFAFENVLHLIEQKNPNQAQARFIDSTYIPSYKQQGLTPYQYPYIDIRQLDSSCFEIGEMDARLGSYSWITYTIKDDVITAEKRDLEMLDDIGEAISKPVESSQEARELSQDEVNELHERLVSWPLVPRQEVIDRYKNRLPIKLAGFLKNARSRIF